MPGLLVSYERSQHGRAAGMLLAQQLAQFSGVDCFHLSYARN
jgi:hypothetical protein